MVLGLFASSVIALFGALAWSENLFSRWIDTRLVTGFIVGAGVATSIALVITLLGMDGSRSYRRGLEAESWTATALNRLRKDGWAVFHDLEFEGHNIDHVLIGPKGAVAVETKLRNEEWTLLGTSIEDKRQRPILWTSQLVGQASRQARTLRSLLFAGGVRTDVLPVLVLWGRGIEGVSRATIDGVIVGRGAALNDWLGQIEAKPLSNEQFDLARKAVERFKAGEGVRKPVVETVAPRQAQPDDSSVDDMGPIAVAQR